MRGNFYPSLFATITFNIKSLSKEEKSAEPIARKNHRFSSIFLVQTSLDIFVPYAVNWRKQIKNLVYHVVTLMRTTEVDSSTFDRYSTKHYRILPIIRIKGGE